MSKIIFGGELDDIFTVEYGHIVPKPGALDNIRIDGKKISGACYNGVLKSLVWYTEDDEDYKSLQSFFSNIDNLEGVDEVTVEMFNKSEIDNKSSC